METIYKRRSIRKYQTKDVAQEDVEKILKAGMNAPSAKKNEPWNFIVVQDKNCLWELSEIKKYALMLKEAPCCIICIAKPNTEFWQQDMGACMQNMMLEATSLGLGTCWLGIKPDGEDEKKIRTRFEIPTDYHVFSLMALGYPNEEKSVNNKFDVTRIHHEKW